MNASIILGGMYRQWTNYRPKLVKLVIAVLMDSSDVHRQWHLEIEIVCWFRDDDAHADCRALEHLCVWPHQAAELSRATSAKSSTLSAKSLSVLSFEWCCISKDDIESEKCRTVFSVKSWQYWVAGDLVNAGGDLETSVVFVVRARTGQQRTKNILGERDCVGLVISYVLTTSITAGTILGGSRIQKGTRMANNKLKTHGREICTLCLNKIFTLVMS